MIVEERNDPEEISNSSTTSRILECDLFFSKESCRTNVKTIERIKKRLIKKFNNIIFVEERMMIYSILITYVQ